MGDWIITDDTLEISHADNTIYALKVRPCGQNKEGLEIIQGSYEGRYEHEYIERSSYLFGRNLEVFREFVMRDTKENLLAENNRLHNGTMTCEIMEIWRIFMEGSPDEPATTAQRKMAKLLTEMAQREDCDMHNLIEITLACP